MQPPSVRLLWEYELQLKALAAKEARLFIKSRTGSASIAALSVVLGAVLHYNFHGMMAMFAELTIWILYVLAGSILSVIIIFTWHALSMPARLSHRDNLRIASLERIIAPRLCIEYEEQDCLVARNRGHHTESTSRFLHTDINGRDCYIRLRCTNKSEQPIANCEAHLINLTMNGIDGQAHALPYHDQLRLRWSSTDEPLGDKAATIHPGGWRHIEVVVQSGSDGIPRIPEAPFHYVRLLEQPGEYSVTVQVSAPNTSRSIAVLKLVWTREHHMVQIERARLVHTFEYDNKVLDMVRGPKLLDIDPIATDRS